MATITDGIELVTGYAGKAHVSSDDIAAFNQGIVGKNDDNMWRMDDAGTMLATQGTTVLIFPKSDWLVDGRFVRVSKDIRVPVPIPPYGYKRQHFLFFVYRKASNGIESTGLELTQDEAFASHQTGGTVAHRVATIQVSTSDIEIQDQNMLKQVIPSLHNLNYRLDAAAQTTSARLPYMDRNVTFYKIGKIVTVSQQVLTTSTGRNAHFTANSERVPDGYRPVNQGVLLMSDNTGVSASMMVNSLGQIEVNGTINGSRYLQVFGSWITA